MRKQKKTLLVGIDAACWSYVDPLLQRNELPVLQRLMDQGSWGTLQSTMPAWTPTAWASLVTGKNPGKHGVFDMVWRQPGSYEFMLVSGQMRQGTPFWKRLNEAGVKVGLVNVPYTYPLEPLDGFVVPGFGTPNSVRDIVFPEEAVSWIHENFPDYEPNVDPDLLRLGAPDDVFVAERQHQERQVAIAIALAERYEVDVLAINLMLLDHANHKMPDMERVEAAIRESDADLGRLLDGFAPDHVLLISDHGSSRVKGNFLLNQWLKDQGYQVQKKRSVQEQKEALNYVLARWLRLKKGWPSGFSNVARWFLTWYWQRTNGRQQQNFWDMLTKDYPFARHFIELKEEIDYAQSRLYPGTIYSGLLYINVEGQEAQGVVDAAKKSELIAEVREKLAQIVEPDTGEPLFGKIYTAEELYHGNMLNYAPDLIIDVFGLHWNIQMGHLAPDVKVIGNHYFVIGEQQEFGWHSRDGVYIFTGASFTEGQSLSKINILDIAPTLLHLYDIPVPEDYDGHVLENTLTADFLKEHPITYQDGDEVGEVQLKQSFSNEEADEIAAHLRALGYVE